MDKTKVKCCNMGNGWNCKVNKYDEKALITAGWSAVVEAFLNLHERTNSLLRNVDFQNMKD